ncbi:MAG: group III truncated hemoglobin [Salibacteraceae bacterium]
MTKAKHKTDINTREDVELLVNAFYKKVGKDPLIGPIFIPFMAGDWQKHLDIMYSFWCSLLLDEGSYQRNAFTPHADMPLEKKHFERWLKLFHTTIDDYFEGKNAQKAKTKSNEIAQIFLNKIMFLKNKS